MTTDVLEGEKTQTEETKPTVKGKGAKPTQVEVKPTVSIEETPEFRHALDKALGKGLESTNRQLSLQKAAAEAAKAEVEQHKAELEQQKAYIESLKREVDEALVDDPEKRQAYISKIASLEKEQKIAKREAEVTKKLYATELKEHDLRMATTAKEHMDKTGVPLEVLEGSLTEEELELRTVKWQLAQKSEVAEKTPKFESGISSGRGEPTEEQRLKERYPTMK